MTPQLVIVLNSEHLFPGLAKQSPLYPGEKHWLVLDPGEYRDLLQQRPSSVTVFMVDSKERYSELSENDVAEAMAICHMATDLGITSFRYSFDPAQPSPASGIFREVLSEILPINKAVRDAYHRHLN